MNKILFNGIPSSGKSTYAHKLHLALEHLGYETVLLDDEVIKRLDAEKIQTLTDYIDAPITIIASCKSDIEADIKLWVDTPIKECEKRDKKRLEQENAPKKGSFAVWEGYQGQGTKVKTWEDVCVALKKTNLNF